MAEFVKGDVVQLKSGGPHMTVNDPSCSDSFGRPGFVQCIFFDGSKRHSELFIPEVLEKV